MKMACLILAATVATVAGQHQLIYSQEAREEGVCYEQNYIDENFKKQGFRAGRCDEKYNVELGRSQEVICNGHSEENIKYCPNQRRTITVLKKGIKSDDVSDIPPPAGVLYNLQAMAETICYETNYTDDHYKEQGFVLGRCAEKYNVIENYTIEVVCQNHSEINIKYCPTTQVSIEVYKFGSKTADVEVAPVANHSIFYHLEAVSEAVCYETNYTDAHYQENGFVVGACSDSYDTLEETKTVTVCNGHSEENIKYCPTSQLNITVLKLGKS